MVSARSILSLSLLVFFFAGASVADRNSSSSVECFLSANSTQITEIPRTLTCRCLQQDVAFSFVDDILARFAQQLVDNVRAVSFAECVNLRIRSGSGARPADRLPHFRDRLSVNVVGANSVVLFDDGGEVIRSFFASNVTHVQVVPARVKSAPERSGTEPPPDNASNGNEQLYFYIMIGLAGLLLTAVILLFSVACCNRKPTDRRSSSSCTLSSCCAKVDPRSKRVSRSDSWRFESNVYVKPTERQRELRQLRGGGARPVQPAMPAPEYSISAAARHMLPYQLVPLREASFIGRDQHEFSARTNSGKQDDAEDDADREAEEDLYCSRPAEDFEVGGSRQSRRASEANTASYGSRNNAATMPLDHAVV
jgi:hypothetical protein